MVACFFAEDIAYYWFHRIAHERRFFWASDFPHPDHAPVYLRELEELVALLPESARRPLLGDNVREAYSLPPRSSAGAGRAA